jgi:hypothetical protein
MLLEEWMDIFLVYEDAALFAGKYEIEVDSEADPRIEGDPVEDEVQP